MKKGLTVLAALVAVLLTVQAGFSLIIYGDNFDSTTSSIIGWQRNNTSYITRYTGTYKVGTACMRIVKNYNAVTYIKTAPFKNMKLSFKMAATSFESGEYMVCQYDAGSGWKTAAKLSDGSDNGSFKSYSVSIPECSVLKIKFYVYSNSTGDYGYIDDIQLTGDRK